MTAPNVLSLMLYSSHLEVVDFFLGLVVGFITMGFVWGGEKDVENYFEKRFSMIVSRYLLALSDGYSEIAQFTAATSDMRFCFCWRKRSLRDSNSCLSCSYWFSIEPPFIPTPLVCKKNYLLDAKKRVSKIPTEGASN